MFVEYPVLSRTVRKNKVVISSPEQKFEGDEAEAMWISEAEFSTVCTFLILLDNTNCFSKLGVPVWAPTNWV